MPKAFFIDTTRCTACRGCQVACKEWHGHPAVKTKQRGTHQNPPELTHYNYKLVRFSEHLIEDKVEWLFFPEQCRHCLDAPCLATAENYVEGAIIKDEATGAILYTDKTRELTKEQFEEVRDMCPYNVPRRNEETGAVVKCDMCIDRVQAGMLPMCVKSCCTGTMNFGEREDMLKLAQTRLDVVRKEHPKAELLDADELAVIYLVSQPRTMYFEFASRQVRPLNRADFLATLAKPFKTALG